jgi:hypothetical protein
MTNSATGSLLRSEILLGIAKGYEWPLERQSSKGLTQRQHNQANKR